MLYIIIKDDKIVGMGDEIRADKDKIYLLHCNKHMLNLDRKYIKLNFLRLENNKSKMVLEIEYR